MINLIGRSIGFNWKKHRLACKERESQGQTALTAGIASNDGVYENWWKGFKMCGDIKLLPESKIIFDAWSGFPATKPLSTKL